VLQRLDEPYRTVLRLRFLEEHSTDEVARLLARNSATVRSQIQRGLELLRERLEPRRRQERWLVWLFGRRRDGAASRLAPAARGVALLSAGASALVFAIFLYRSLAHRGSNAELANSAATSAAPARDVERLAPASTSRVEIGPAATQPDVAAAASTTALDTATTTASIAVVVVDPDGAPVPGASVRIASRDALVARATTGALGSALIALSGDERGAFGAPATRDSVTLQATVAGRAASAFLHVPLAQCDGREQRLVVGGPELRFSGRVLDEDGRALAAAHVSCTGNEQFKPGPGDASFQTPGFCETRADARGEFVLEHLVRGPFLVRVSAQGCAPQEARLVPADAARLEQTFVLQRAAALTGRVRRPNGTPAAGARVFAEPNDRPSVWAGRWADYDLRLDGRTSSARADELGAFRLGELAPGRRRIWALEDGALATAILELASNEEAHWEAELQPTPGLALRVVDGAGAPLAGLHVKLSSAGAARDWIRILETDADGGARLLDCPPEELIADVLDARMLGLLASAVELAPGDAEQRIVIGEHALLRGVLLDARGHPLAQPELKRFDPSSGRAVALAVDPLSGRFEQALVPGPFLLACVVERRGFSLGLHELAPGEILDLGVVFAPSTGRLVLLRGAAPAPSAPPVQFRVSVQYPVPGQPIFRELVRGSWPPPEELELFPGRHCLDAFDASGRRLFRSWADVPENGNAGIDLP